MLTFDGTWHFWRGDLFTDESLYRADGRQSVWVSGFADVNVVDRVTHGGGGVDYGMGRHMLWTTNKGAFY